MSMVGNTVSSDRSSGPVRVDVLAGVAGQKDGVASMLDAHDVFVTRHIGPTDGEMAEMLGLLGYSSMDAMIADTVPPSIRSPKPLTLSWPAGPDPRGEYELLGELAQIAKKNQVWKSCLGMGYYRTIVPPVILRNVMENPGWYTQYTPYQAEIAQGRLEALLNFQTMVSDLTGLELAGSSLLDEGTAAGEAIAMAVNIAARKPRRVFVASDCHPQTLAVVRTRARHMGIEVVEGDPKADFNPAEGEGYAGVLVQYPTTDGRVECYRELAEASKAAGTVVIAATDLLALTLLTPPGEWGADICIGSAQRLGVPMGFGGPHAGFLATSQAHVRRMPGRIVGVSKDAEGRPALRLAIQTREQHIKRDRATSNICTAQVLLAVMASMYAVYHGPDGLKRIAERTRAYTGALRAGLEKLGHDTGNALAFDTLRVRVTTGVAEVLARASSKWINLRDFGDGTIGVSLDETADRDLVRDILWAFGDESEIDVDALASRADLEIPGAFSRTSDYLTHEVFNTHDSETEMLRYLHTLQSRDLSLTHSMIPLGSCTMKLNATSEMIPVTWPEFGHLHPFAPADQTQGYKELFTQLEAWLCEITGFAACSLQPNSGAQGEYAGLLAIKGYHEANGQGHRNVCIVPESAHGTNPASAVLAGMKVVSVKNRADGAIDYDDLRAKVEKHSESLSALMVTYPSTCGLFDENIRDLCAIVHEHGGQVYMDGANMNAQVGLTSPGEIGADVCHLNLHKTFCIPHGGGGPGMGPICCAKHLAPHLAATSLDQTLPNEDTGEHAKDMVSAAPYGSASILPISWVYIALMGGKGLKAASEAAILNANYMAKRLKGAYDVLFHGSKGRVAHEFVIDCRPFKKSAGIEIDDIAKRLIDFGFHAPTMSWPVPGTLMIEPTESESKDELDRFCEAMLAIREEIAQVERGELPADDNPLKNAPHTTSMLTGDWNHPYSRETGVFPAPWVKDHKFWPFVARIDNPFGDRNLVCSCAGVDELAEC